MLTKKTPGRMKGRVKHTRKVATPVMKSGESVSVLGHSKHPYRTMLPSITYGRNIKLSFIESIDLGTTGLKGNNFL